MTKVGIYKLNFRGTDQVYIGQSIDVDRRYKQHLYYIENNYPVKTKFSIYQVRASGIRNITSMQKL